MEKYEFSNFPSFLWMFHSLCFCSFSSLFIGFPFFSFQYRYNIHMNFPWVLILGVSWEYVASWNPIGWPCIGYVVDTMTLHHLTSFFITLVCVLKQNENLKFDWQHLLNPISPNGRLVATWSRTKGLGFKSLVSHVFLHHISLIGLNSMHSYSPLFPSLSYRVSWKCTIMLISCWIFYMHQ